MVLPFKWSELTPDHKKDIQDNHGELSFIYDLVSYETGLVMPRLFAEEVADKVYDFKLRNPLRKKQTLTWLIRSHIYSIVHGLLSIL